MTPPDLSRFTRRTERGYIWLDLKIRDPLGSLRLPGLDWRAANIYWSAGCKFDNTQDRYGTTEQVLERVQRFLGAKQWFYEVNPCGEEVARFLMRRPQWWDRALRNFLHDRHVDWLVNKFNPST